MKTIAVSIVGEASVENNMVLVDYTELKELMAYATSLQTTIEQQQAVIVGAEFLIKKLSFERDLSIGMETMIDEFMEDFKALNKLEDNTDERI